MTEETQYQQQEKNIHRVAHFIFLKELSKGIHQVQHRKNKILYSLRILTSNQVQPFHNIIRKLQNQGIQQLIDTWTEQSMTYVLQLWQRGGDLQQYMSRNPKFQEQEIWSICSELIDSISYVHSKGVIHRDIKPANIFIGNDGLLKLGDFGCAILDDSPQNDQFGTPLYMAPEVLRKQKYDNKIDMWSLGCIIYLLSAGKLPFQGQTLQSLTYNIIFRKPSPLPSKFSQQLRTLVDKLLEKDPRNRSDSIGISKFCQEKINTSFCGSGIRLKSIEQIMYNRQTSQNLEIDFDQSLKSEPIVFKGELMLSPLSPIPKILRPKTAFINPRSLAQEDPELITVIKQQDIYENLFSKIKCARPNSAVNFTGKQYIQESLVKDIQQKRINGTNLTKLNHEKIREVQSAKVLKLLIKAYQILFEFCDFVHRLIKNSIKSLQNFLFYNNIQPYSPLIIREPEFFNNIDISVDNKDKQKQVTKNQRVRFIPKSANGSLIQQQLIITNKMKAKDNQNFKLEGLDQKDLLQQMINQQSEIRFTTERESKLWQERIKNAMINK